MKKIKKESLERIKAEIAVRINQLEAIRFHGEPITVGVQPDVFFDGGWSGFALLLKPDDYEDEEDVIPQPGLFAEVEPLPRAEPIRRRVRPMNPRLKAIQDEIMAHFPFIDGFVDVPIDGVKVSTARKAIERMFKGADGHHSPQKWDNTLSDRDCRICQVDNSILRVLIRKKQ